MFAHPSTLFVLLLASSLVLSQNPKGHMRGDVVLVRPEVLRPPPEKTETSSDLRARHPAIVTDIRGKTLHVALMSHNHPPGTPTKPTDNYDGLLKGSHISISQPRTIRADWARPAKLHPNRMTKGGYAKLMMDIDEYRSLGGSSSQTPSDKTQDTSASRPRTEPKTAQPPAASTSSGPSIRAQQNTSRRPPNKSKAPSPSATSNTPSPLVNAQDDGWNLVERRKPKNSRK